MKEIKENNKNDFFKIFNMKNNNIINYGNVILNNEKKAISTGCLQLDQAIGIGGLPRGKIIEIYGNESCGKTTLTLQIIKKAQEEGLRCLFLDLENSLNTNFLQKIGINLKELIIANPLSGEQTFEIIEKLLIKKEIDLIVVDSVAAMLPEIEKTSDFDSIQVGAHARLMSRGLRKITPLIANNDACVIFVNQIREKIGVFFGNPETTTGGKALKFFASIRMEIKKTELIKSGLDKVGIKSKITITKNKLAAPLKTAYFNIYFEDGYNEKNEIINFAIDFNVIEKRGSWYYYNQQQIAQGIDQLNNYIKDNNEIYENIKSAVLEKIKI